MKLPRITASELACRLNAVKTADGWMARCPAHDDHTPSLSIKAGSDGRVLLNCFAGCKFEEIVLAMQIEPVQLFALKERKRAISDAKLIVANYDYVDASNTLIFQVVRYEPKSFMQRQPDGKCWIWDTKGIEKPLYRLPKVIEAIAKGRRIYLCEGEKDVHSLESLGQYATCNAGGAGKWCDRYTAALRGADLVIVADKDESGRKHAQQVKNAVAAVVTKIKIIELPDRNGKAVKDASDWISEGGTLLELEAIVQSAPEPEPAPELSKLEVYDVQKLKQDAISAKAAFQVIADKFKLISDQRNQAARTSELAAKELHDAQFAYTEIANAVELKELPSDKAPKIVHQILTRRKAGEAIHSSEQRLRELIRLKRDNQDIVDQYQKQVDLIGTGGTRDS